MRAVCEKCNAAQPPDWKAGDLCSACGAAVRRDVRCFWCAKWTPFAKFCRSCGAETVEETLYGAARMLKDAGTDRFTVPKMLREMDPDQRDNFTRIYQRHAVTVARHVDDVRFLERFLFHKDFSAALEDQLVPQLPWNDETLKGLTLPPTPPGNDLATVTALEKASPFDSTQALAAIARLHLSDWGAYREAAQAFHSYDGAIRAEAALALSSWRARSSVGRLRDIEHKVAEELERSPFPLPAAVRLAFLGRANPDRLREALGSDDPELSFPAALALEDVDRLQAALKGDDLQKAVAGNKLISLGIIKPVEQVIEKSPIEVQQELVAALASRKGPAPEAADTLLSIVETTDDKTLRERAARVLCRELRPEWAMRIARAARKDSHIFQSLLSKDAALPPETISEFASWMVENGHFTMSQYGMDDAASRGALPDTFAPMVFGRAPAETQTELLRLAEKQLEARGDETLHRFVMGAVFGPHPAKVRSAAWWALHRWYRHLGEYRGEGPFKLQKEIVERFFGSVEAFLPKLAAVLRDPDTLKEVGVYEFLANLLASATPGMASPDLVAAVLEAMRGDYWSNLLESMIKFLAVVGVDPRWRSEVIAGLEALGKKGNYHWEKTLRTLRLSVHGIPDEPEWSKLPSEFVSDRFSGATPEGRLALLRVAEEQLIHGEHPALLRFLLCSAFGEAGPDARAEALRIWTERGGRLFRLSRAAVEEHLGSLPEFLDAAGPKLGEPGLTEFFCELLEHPTPETVRCVVDDEGSAGRLVRSLLAYAAKDSPQEQDNLRHWAIFFAGKLGEDPRWRAEVVDGLTRIAASTTGNLSAGAKNALRDLQPPPAPEPVQVSRPVRPIPSPPPPVENPWQAKQKEAERLGKELQEKAMTISFGTGSPEEKSRQIMKLQEDFQARLKALYGM